MMLKKDNRSLRKRPLFSPLLMPILATFVAAIVIVWVWNSSSTTTVILVRHAEKMPEPKKDPALSALGVYRSTMLASWLRDAGVEHIYVSEYLRTRQTGEIVADSTNAEIHELPARDVRQLVRLLRGRHRGETVLVIGHSNTVPEVISALGGDTVEIDESDHSSLFVVTDSRITRTRVLKLRYGG